MKLKCAPLAGVLAGVLPFFALADEVGETRETFTSGGQPIEVEVFQPQAAGLHPALLILHGAGGLIGANGFVRQLAPAFVACGFSTYVVHYMDRTGETWVADQDVRKNFETWLSTVTDAVSFVAKQPAVDRNKVATFGFSLGAYLAVAQAARDQRIRAVVELSGGIDPAYAAQTTHMPPTLILHGEADNRVAVDRATELNLLLGRLGAPHQMQLYPNEGHVLSPKSAVDAMVRGVNFLNRYVRGGQPIGGAEP